MEEGKHTGLYFWAQLKGTRRLKKLKDGSLSFKLETKHLDYYTRVETPVFLILIDVKSGKVYWCFTQNYAKTELRNVNWKAQDSIQLRIKPSNTLANLRSFREAVVSAVKEMNRLTFHSDLQSEERWLEELDPRFKVNISAEADRRHYRFHSNESIPIEFRYKEEDARSEKIEDLLDRGKPVLIKNGEIEIIGSPLFQALLDLAGASDVLFEFNKTYDGHINMVRKTKFGVIVSKFDAIPCKMVCGRCEARIEAQLLGNLFSLSATLPLESKETANVSIGLDLSVWEGSRLQELRFFEQMAGLFMDVADGDQMAIEFFAPGQRVFTGVINYDPDQTIRGSVFLIEMLSKARAVGELCATNPKLLKNFGSSRSLHEIQFLHEMLIGQGLTESTSSANVRVTLSRNGLKQFLSDIKGSSVLGTLNLYGDGSFPFLGETIRIEPVERIATNMRLLDLRGDLQRQLKSSPHKRNFHLNWGATKTTKTTIVAHKKMNAQAIINTSDGTNEGPKALSVSL